MTRGKTHKKIFLGGLGGGSKPANKLGNLTISQTKNIFLGLTTAWNSVGGSNLSTTIDPIGRNSAAGQYTFFQQSVLGGATQSSNVAQDTSDGLVQVGVGHDPNAIGYVGLAHSGSPVKSISVNGVPCQASTIRSKTYPLFRFDWGVIPTGQTSVKVEQFLHWVHEQGRREDHQPRRCRGGLQQVGRGGSRPPWMRSSSRSRSQG